jgi:hypothetical protein
MGSEVFICESESQITQIVKKRKGGRAFQMASSVLGLRTESFPILSRNQKRLDHFSVDETAVEVIQFREPKVIAGVVSVRRIIRISPQVPEELHQDERAIELGSYEVRVLRN